MLQTTETEIYTKERWADDKAELLITPQLTVNEATTDTTKCYFITLCYRPLCPGLALSTGWREIYSLNQLFNIPDYGSLKDK